MKTKQIRLTISLDFPYWNVGEYLSKEAKNTAFGNHILILLLKKYRTRFRGLKDLTGVVFTE